jgi:NAD(P)-dependent dehydrogenase (short-subunit alcohol dehydrogenase family)
MMKQILITGTNLGIGLELTRQLVARGERVIATCRQPDQADALQDLTNQFGDQLLILPLDVSDDASVQGAKTAVNNVVDRLDMLINNAGILVGGETLSNFDAANMQRSFDVNAVGVMRVVTQFVDLLRLGNDPKVVNISSQLASLQKMRPQWGRYSYNSSKAALNMVSRMLSFDLQEDGIALVVLHPGWVQTDMGGGHAAVTPQDSAAGILQVADNLTLANTGKFYTYAGEEYPW